MERGGFMSVLGDILKRPLITEKAIADKEKFGRYTFEVSSGASKPAIRKAVQDFFKVKVTDVRTLVVRGKVRRIGRYSGKRANWKKAIVTLAEGQKIDMFEAK
jgi:large subunit ribosomal protein L23